MDAGESLDDGALAMRHMADGADVDGGLTGDDVWSQWSESGDVQRREVLLRQKVIRLLLVYV